MRALLWRPRGPSVGSAGRHSPPSTSFVPIPGPLAGPASLSRVTILLPPFEPCTVFNMLWAPLPISGQVTREFFNWGIVGIFSAHRHPLPSYMGDDFTRSVSSRHTGTPSRHTWRRLHMLGIFSAHRHPLPPYMATILHARYLLGTPAPSSATHGDDFPRSVSSRHTGTVFRRTWR
jgi:hypothetical protein